MSQTKLTTFIVEKYQQILMRIREALLHTGGVVERIYERGRNVHIYIYSWDKLFGLCGSKRVVWITSNVMLPRQFQLKVNTHVHLERKISSFFAVLSQENHFSLQFPIPRKKTVFFFFAHQKPSTSLLVNTMDQNSRGGKKKIYDAQGGI